MLFDPLNFDREIIISFGLISPRITVLFFVIANILLPSIAAFMYNAKVTTMQDTRVGSILYFDSENTGGIFGVIISENRISIRIRDLVETFVKNVSYFFGGIIFVGVIYFNIHIEVKTSVRVSVTGYHLSFAAAHKMIFKSKIISDFILQSVDNFKKFTYN